MPSPVPVATDLLRGRAYYVADIAEFLAHGDDTIIAALVNASSFAVEPAQRGAWHGQIATMRDALAGWETPGLIAFEFAVPRMGKRIDVLIVAAGMVFVLEFKVGALEFAADAVNQVWDYALDMKNFHSSSHGAAVVPILVATAAAHDSVQISIESDRDGVVRPLRAATHNPLLPVAVADQRADTRRQRRALTEEELARLLDAAQRRPLADAMTVRRGEAKGQAQAKVTPATRENLLRIGRERALIYKTLVLTGLRKGELASITVGQVDLGGRVPHLLLNARDEKNRRGSEIPLRADLAADIRAWLADRLAWAQQAARDAEEPIPAARPSDEPLFEVPDGLIRIFDRDLVFAGLARIEKRGGKEVVVKTDDRGRTIDIYALRHTFGTHLSKAGVPLRTAQAAMRHSDPSLTANVYTDPKLLDVAGAVASLPDLPLGKRETPQSPSLHAQP